MTTRRSAAAGLSDMLMWAALVALTAAAGCSPGKPPKTKSESPAKVEAHPSEVDIYRIVLTPKAEERLQISTVEVERQSVPRHRSLGGDVVIPDGNRITVTAPLTGTLASIGSN